MQEIFCDYCRKNFLKKKSQILRSDKHYCSSACQYNARKSGVTVACFLCGREVYKIRKTINGSKYKKFFCSRNCSNVWLGKKHSGSNHPNWTTGKFSYRSMMKKNSSVRACVLCAKNDSRILAVHHVDSNRENNSSNNLAWVCHNCHFLIHHYPAEKAKFLKLH